MTLITLMVAQTAVAQVVTFFTPQTVRIQKSAEGGAVQRCNSFVVTATPEAVKVKTRTQGNLTTYTSSALSVSVNHATGHRPPRYAVDAAYAFLERMLGKGG